MPAGTPERFGRYTLVRRLAIGGTAEVFLASFRRGARFRKQVVLKRLQPTLDTDPDSVRMLIDEAALLAPMSHPNVVQVIDFDAVNGVHFIAMEYVDGVDLRQLLDAAKAGGRRLTFAQVAALGEGAARGLAYVHGARDAQGRPLQIVHRDVSPHNIMVSRSGDAKVTDFGIAKAAARLTHTATGSIKGKIAYMAPEQAAGGSVNKACDQFALGLVLWELLAGDRHFQAPSDGELLRQVQEAQIRSLRPLRPDLPAELEAIVMRMLARRPCQRYGDLTDAAEDLMHFRVGLGEQGNPRVDALVRELAPREPVAEPPSRHTEPRSPLGTDTSGETRLQSETSRTAFARSISVATRSPRALRLGRQAALAAMLLGLVFVAPAAVPDETAAQPAARAGAIRSDETEMGAADRPSPRPEQTPPGSALEEVERNQGPAVQWNAADASPAASQIPMGLLSLRTLGTWADVYLDDEPLGTTPVTRARVPAGRLRLRLVNRAAQIDITQAVSVRAEQETRRTVTLLP